MDRSLLRRSINKHFNKTEFRNLCFDLSVDYEELGGETLSDKVRELILFLERHHGLDKLLNICAIARPNFDWSMVNRLSEPQTPIIISQSPKTYGEAISQLATALNGTSLRKNVERQNLDRLADYLEDISSQLLSASEVFEEGKGGYFSLRFYYSDIFFRLYELKKLLENAFVSQDIEQLERFLRRALKGDRQILITGEYEHLIADTILKDDMDEGEDRSSKYTDEEIAELITREIIILREVSGIFRGVSANLRARSV